MSTEPSLQSIDHSDPTPKYVQTQRIVLDAIRAGELLPGDRLPSTKEIGSLVNVSLITAHRAMEGLVESGWLRREVGRGTYVRNDIDLNASSERTLSIALVLDRQANINDYYHGAILEGLRRAARDDPRQVDFFFQDRLALHTPRRSENVGAICIHPEFNVQSEVESLARSCPVLVLGGAYPDSDVAVIDCDNHAGAREAARHLATLGHRRIMIVSGPMNMSNARDRANGALAELRECGIRVDDRDLPVSQDALAIDNRVRERIARRLADRDRPTAIVAGGFYLALDLMRLIRSAGLSVPRDISVVSFDDPISAALVDPPMTTVRQPLERMAAEAYQAIRGAIVNGNAVSTSQTLSPELVVRGSTGPV